MPVGARESGEVAKIDIILTKIIRQIIYQLRSSGAFHIQMGNYNYSQKWYGLVFQGYQGHYSNYTQERK